MCNCIAPAIPDFSWTAGTDGIVAADGFAVVVVQPTGERVCTDIVQHALPPFKI